MPLLAFLSATLVSACGGPPPVPFTPVADTKLLMQSVVDPNADIVWEAVKIISTKDGDQDIRPKTDAEWVAVRNAAVTVAESGNLLMMVPRAKDGGEWMQRAQEMIKAGEEAMRAADQQERRKALHRRRRSLRFVLELPSKVSRRDRERGQVIGAFDASVALSVDPGRRRAARVRAGHASVGARRRAPSRSAGDLEFLDHHAARTPRGIRRQGVPHRRGSGAVRGAHGAAQQPRHARAVGRRRRGQRLQRVLVGPRRPRRARQRPDAHLADCRSAGRPDSGADRRTGSGGRRRAPRRGGSIRPTAPRIDRSASAACSSTPGRRCCRARTTTTSRFSRPPTTS